MTGRNTYINLAYCNVLWTNLSLKQSAVLLMFNMIAWGYFSALKLVCCVFLCVFHSSWSLGPRSTPGIEVVSDTRPAAAKTAVGLRDRSSSIPLTPPPRSPPFTMESRCRENPHPPQITETTPRYFLRTFTKLFVKECTLFYQEVIWSFWHSNLSVNSSPWPYKLILTQMASHCHNACHNNSDSKSNRSED